MICSVCGEKVKALWPSTGLTRCCKATYMDSPIEERIAEVQATWSPEERRARLNGYENGVTRRRKKIEEDEPTWEVPVCKLDPAMSAQLNAWNRLHDSASMIGNAFEEWG